MKIAVAGTGYVGLSIATLLSQHHEVMAVDIIPEKVDLINHKKSPIQDEYIEKYLAEKDLNLTATLDAEAAYKDADFVVIAAPTNYDPVKNFFDTHHIEDVIDLVLSVNPKATMVIKSTIPVGYCRSLYVKYAQKFAQMEPLADGKRREFRLLFSPEFLRESKALEDNLWPSRIIVGYPKMMSEEWEEENEAIRKIQGNHMEECRDIRKASSGKCHQREYRHSFHGIEGGRSCKTLCQHLSCSACQLFQRARYLCRSEGT